jgi:hypothetical protein
VSAPEFQLLLLREPFQPVVTLPCRTSTVLIHAVENPKNGKTDDGNLTAEVDGVAGVVLGRVLPDIGPPV